MYGFPHKQVFSTNSFFSHYPKKFYIPSLEMYIPSFEMYIPRLEIYIPRLEMYIPSLGI